MRTTAALAILLLAATAGTQDTPHTRLRSIFHDDASCDVPHAEYPRPKLVRADWLSLNGAWDFAIRPVDAGRPDTWTSQICVPFPVESTLSGITQAVGAAQRAWYRREVAIPTTWRDRRIVLHFGAVDWEAAVFVDGVPVGTHTGGYDPFAFDVTAALAGDRATHEIVVAAWDPTDASSQPRGKQVERPHGIWYTPTTGIWQSVWLEPVPDASIERVVAVPDLAAKRVRVRVATHRGAGMDVVVVAADGAREVARGRAPVGEEIALSLTDVRTWSPEDPFLYGLRVELRAADRVVDAVRSDFGMRSIEVRPDADGIPRMLLNGEPRFMLGLLDQGFWPDGLYTAPSDRALRHDLELTKALGFDTARKHVKVEPQRWYQWCDEMGVLVWQDIPSSGPYIGPNDPDAKRDAQQARQYLREAGAIVDALEVHPSVVMWVPFNEGWGQADTERVAAWFTARDPSRLVDATSGWADRGVGSVRDVHVYPGPGMPRLEDRRAAVLGEFGGLGLPLRDHTWQDAANWGYRSFTDLGALNDAYVELIRRLPPLVARGLCAAIYTQTTDVEIEVNGVATYDRAIVKLDAARVRPLHDALRGPPPRVRVVTPTSREQPQTWRYRFDDPGSDWTAVDHDDAAWSSGPGGFGTEGTPGAVVRTRWNGPRIWLRRTIEIPADVDTTRLWLDIDHDEDAVVYIDGEPIAELGRWSDGYVFEPLDPARAKRLTPGRHVLAVECRQTNGGQFIDVGIVELRPR